MAGMKSSLSNTRKEDSLLDFLWPTLFFAMAGMFPYCIAPSLISYHFKGYQPMWDLYASRPKRSISGVIEVIVLDRNNVGKMRKISPCAPDGRDNGKQIYF